MAQRGGKMQQETKTAMQELVAELDRTRKEYAKSTLQVTQLETLVEHMRDAEQKKDIVVQHLEAELDGGRRLHGQEIAVITEEYRTKESAIQHTVSHLQTELTRLAEENRVFSGYELESRQLREALLETQSKLERLSQINDDLKARVKGDMRDFRTNLEGEFKKRLIESEKKFRAEAYKALSEEAKVALQGNDQLQSVLQRQNDSIESVLGRCKQLEGSHSKLKSEQDVSNQNLQHHVSETTRLRKQLNDTKAKNGQLEDVLRQRKVERASLELLFIEYEASRKQLTRAQEKSKRYMKEAERWKARAMQLSYDVSTGNHQSSGVGGGGDPGSPNLERRVSRARAQIKEVEDSLNPTRRRSLGGGKGASPRTPREQGEVEDWSDVSDGGNGEGDDEAAQTKASITPMEILAMWNVNFESWRDSSAANNTDGGNNDPTMTHIPEGGSPAVTPALVQHPHVSYDTTASYAEPTQASQSRTRKTRGPTAEEQRAMAERNLSVVSQRRYQNVPPSMQRKVGLPGGYGRKEARPISMSELSIVGTDGTFNKIAVGTINPANARFLIP